VSDKPMDHHDAIRLLREVVAGREDYVYERVLADIDNDGHPAPSCLYYVDGKPSCVVGHVMNRWDPDFRPPEGSSPRLMAMFPGDPVSALAAEVFAAAQEKQDEGCTWGTALAAAEQRYADIVAQALMRERAQNARAYLGEVAP
jgi:hypothetical protein